MSKQENMSHKMCFIDETETEESTQFGVESHQPNSYNSKKSINFYSSKNFLESTNHQIPKRKYTLESSMCIRDFVPHPKPLEIHFVPSKLRLNTKGFKDFKINQSNKILLDSNNYYISCPGSDNSDSEDDQYLNLRSTNTMKDMRKKMTIQKKSIPKVLSKQVVSKNSLSIEKDNAFNDSELYSGDENEQGDDFVLSGVEDISGLEHKSLENSKSQPKKIRETRLNSCSILQILESNSKC